MNDRQLLEAAAKAAGMTVAEPFHGDVDEWMWWEAMQCLNCRTAREESKCWNPLTDDGDALRLAVRLGMVIAIDADNNQVAAVAADDAAGLETMQPEPYAATRRAICMAAAKLGEDLMG